MPSAERLCAALASSLAGLAMWPRIVLDDGRTQMRGSASTGTGPNGLDEPSPPPPLSPPSPPLPLSPPSPPLPPLVVESRAVDVIHDEDFDDGGESHWQTV